MFVPYHKRVPGNDKKDPSSSPKTNVEGIIAFVLFFTCTFGAVFAITYRYCKSQLYGDSEYVKTELDDSFSTELDSTEMLADHGQYKSPDFTPISKGEAIEVKSELA